MTLKWDIVMAMERARKRQNLTLDKLLMATCLPMQRLSAAV